MGKKNTTPKQSLIQRFFRIMTGYDIKMNQPMYETNFYSTGA